ncbi:MAG: ATP phosphoribosyltransferase [Nitrosomonadales bacterium]|jgi:ATP phosphoribosyltransferase|nr:ATP phosphoribosyltransferase [Nitrosomonadales bacterium]MBT3917736.1 ATP phosphoribosyltransferase [Nitrosomonadales bacterium]MBT4183044.1 ATP phosphoribosyltransferase [Nitrosomonadales bacterium]MBT4570933.1 ATP phosphoribosyltransferase [Nitrosomonadales bacterium]MBT4758922.1 ATP phosphoribosyltransferase [Nitrosomonadales bacterium]
MITIALSKGRIFTETMPMLNKLGIFCEENPETSRKLVFETNKKNLQLIIVRASDVPTYVEWGGADIGIAGKDVMDEFQGKGLFQPLDLGIGKCQLMVAGRKEFDYEAFIKQKIRLRVATKYPQAARKFFSEKGVHIDVIKLYGSMELAPIVGMSDVIVDLVSSGKTLEANNLIAYEKISDVSSRLIINQAALKIKRKQLKPLIENFSEVVL